jgi:predicted amino acid-binding ACT domain protein
LHITHPKNSTQHDRIHIEDVNVVGEPIVTQNGVIYPIDQLANSLADFNLSINDVSEQIVDDLFHFSDSFKSRGKTISSTP